MTDVRNPRRGPTIDDVAHAAGVSRGTVSRVLNGARYVSPPARNAVDRAIRETGYVANQSARALATRRTNAVAFVLSEPQERLFEDPNFSTLLRASTQALAARDTSVMLMLAAAPNDRTRLMRFLRGGHADGVLLVSTHGGDPILDELEQIRLPVVACGRPLGHESAIPFVGADERGGARQMTQHLLDRGRRRIGIITGPLDTPGGRERLEGYTEVLGRDTRRELIVAAEDYSAQAGDAAMGHLLASSSDVDAVFVASDLLAAGALAALRRAGRRVPDDVAVGGFDDSRVAVSTDPLLSTVRQPLEDVAHDMVEMLLHMIDGGQAASRVLSTELIVRNST